MFNKMLLATAAVIVTVAGASAADLPSKKAAPATYVKICDTFGAGFFFIPGSDTCLKIGGRVRYDLAYMPTGNYFDKNGQKDLSVQDTYGMHVRGRITLDARTNSDFGTVRTYLGLRTDYNTGLLTGVQSPYGDSSAADYIAKKTTQPVMEFAYVQFAGFTAGKMPEVMSGDWYGNSYSYNRYASFSTGVFGISYTAVLPGGFSATVGMEDPNDFDGNNVAAYSKASSTSTSATSLSGSTYTTTTTTTTTLAGALASPYQTPYNSLPVFVGKLAWDQSWGQIQVSGGVSRNRMVYDASSTTVPLFDITRTGYAVGGQLTLNADMIAKGDKFYLLGGYSNGLNKLGFKNGHKDSGYSRDVTGISQSWSNFYCDTTTTLSSTVAVPTTCENTKSTWGSLNFLHFWTPSIRQNVFSGVAMVDPGSFARGNAANTQKTTYTQVGTNVIWSPTKGFDIGVEAMYDRASVGNAVATANLAKAGGCASTVSGGASAGCSASGNNFVYRLRVQRDF